MNTAPLVLFVGASGVGVSGWLIGRREYVWRTHRELTRGAAKYPIANVYHHRPLSRDEVEYPIPAAAPYLLPLFEAGNEGRRECPIILDRLDHHRPLAVSHGCLLHPFPGRHQNGTLS